jgi:hypothetical protein
MLPPVAQTIAPLLVALALGGIATAVRWHGTADTSTPDALPERIYIPEPKVVALASLGFERAVTDLYWLRLVNYTGDTRYADQRVQLSQLYPLAEMITDLQPTFASVYTFAGIALSDGRWHTRLLEANCLYRKAVRNIPADYTFYMWLGFNQWYWLGDRKGASDSYAAGAPVSPVPELLLGISQRLLVEKGQYGFAIQLLQERYERTRDRQVRAILRKQIVKLSLQVTLDAVSEAAATYRKEKGRLPKTADELLAAGYIPARPVDPYGGEIRIDDTGLAYSSTLGIATELKLHAPYAGMPEPSGFACRAPGAPLVEHAPVPTEGGTPAP